MYFYVIFKRQIIQLIAASMTFNFIYFEVKIKYHAAYSKYILSICIPVRDKKILIIKFSANFDENLIKTFIAIL